MLCDFKFLLPPMLAFLSGSALAAPHPTMAQVLAGSSPADWRPLDPQNTLYVDLPTGRPTAADLPQAQRSHLEVMRTDSRTRSAGADHRSLAVTRRLLDADAQIGGRNAHFDEKRQ